MAVGAGFGQVLEQSRDFFDVLLGLGEMHRAVHNGQRMLFIADEAYRLEAVESDEAIQQHWMTANKLIFDDNNRSFGFIYTVSGRVDDLPLAIWDPQIQNRLGNKAFQLLNLAPSDVGIYLDRLREEFIDRNAVDAAVAQNIIDPNEYSWDDYPFTPDAKQRFIEYFDTNQQDSKPRDISNSLNDVAFLAAKLDKHLIDEDCLNSRGM